MRVFIFGIIVTVFYIFHLYMGYMGIAIPAFVNIIMIGLAIYFSLVVFTYFVLRFVMFCIPVKEQLKEVMSKTNLTRYAIDIMVAISLLGMYSVYVMSTVFFVVYSVGVLFMLFDSKKLNEYLPE